VENLFLVKTTRMNEFAKTVNIGRVEDEKFFRTKTSYSYEHNSMDIIFMLYWIAGGDLDGAS
jgi:hypothetical protein